MKLRRTLRMATHALRRNVLRSALTTLGIIIGVAAVIAMMEIGQGSSTAIRRTIASMGANNLLVQPGTASSGGVTFGSRSIVTLTPQGANMMGLDQDDIVLAPWTTIKYRVSGSSLTNVNQSAAVVANPTQTVNTLNQLYPGTAASLYPTPSPTQMADTPLPVRFTNVDQILTAATTSAEIPVATRQVTQVLHERHRIRAGQPDDFNIRDM